MVNATFVAAAGDLDLSRDDTIFVAVVAGVAVLALILAAVFRAQVVKQSEGTEKMQEIGRAVQEGASAYLSRQFKTLIWFVVPIAVGLYFLPSTTGDSTTKADIGRSVSPPRTRAATRRCASPSAPAATSA